MNLDQRRDGLLAWFILVTQPFVGIKYSLSYPPNKQFIPSLSLFLDCCVAALAFILVCNLPSQDTTDRDPHTLRCVRAKASPPSPVLHQSPLLLFFFLFISSSTSTSKKDLFLSWWEITITLMGNYRFRLSDMMPNAWFYKLKDMSHIANRSKNHRGAATPPPQAKLLPGRASFYYSSRAEAERFSFSPTKSKALADRFEELPRKSKRGSRKKPPAEWPRPVASPSPELAPPETPRKDFLDFASGKSDPCCCKVISSATDIIIDLGAGDSVELNLRPVATKPVLQGDTDSVGSDKRRPSSSPGGARRLRVRANSPRLAHRSRAARRQKKALPESALAVVKASSDPQRDFRDSMMEMIVEHNIRASTDLEELLACYLSLNSDEYHDLIVKVFKQIWFDLN